MCYYKSWFGLNQRCSVLKNQRVEAKEISAEERWFKAGSLWNSADQLWCFSCSLNQRWTALQNVKSMKQRFWALTIAGTSTRKLKHTRYQNWLATRRSATTRIFFACLLKKIKVQKVTLLYAFHSSFYKIFRVLKKNRKNNFNESLSFHTPPFYKSDTISRFRVFLRKNCQHSSKNDLFSVHSWKIWLFHAHFTDNL